VDDSVGVARRRRRLSPDVSGSLLALLIAVAAALELALQVILLSLVARSLAPDVAVSLAACLEVKLTLEVVREGSLPREGSLARVLVPDDRVPLEVALQVALVVATVLEVSPAVALRASQEAALGTSREVSKVADGSLRNTGN